MAQFKKTVIFYPLCIVAIWLPCVFLGVMANRAADVPEIKEKQEARRTLATQGATLAPEPRDELRAKMAGDDVLLLLLERYAPLWLAGLLGAGIMAAVMATDSQILALSTMFTEDVFTHYGGKARFGEACRCRRGARFVVALTVFAYVVALHAPESIFELAIQYALPGFAALSPLLVAALFWRRQHASGARWRSRCGRRRRWRPWRCSRPSFPRRRPAGRWWRWPRAGSTSLARTPGGTAVLGFMPVVPMVLVSAPLMIVVSLLTRRAGRAPPSPATSHPPDPPLRRRVNSAARRGPRRTGIPRGGGRSSSCASRSCWGWRPGSWGTPSRPSSGVGWGLDAGEVGWLTSAVQLGFVVGTAVSAILNLPDLVSGRVLVAVCALGAAASNASLLAAPAYPAALASRFATGVFLAGVYPPAMKMVATWFRSARGLAIGALIGALTMGKALPYLLRAAEGARWQTVVLSVSAGTAAAALLVALAYTDGPFAFPAPAFFLDAGRGHRHPPRDEARHPRLPRPHVGAVRDVDVAAGVPGRQRHGARRAPPKPPPAPRRCTRSRPSASGPRAACGEDGWPTASAGSAS